MSNIILDHQLGDGTVMQITKCHDEHTPENSSGQHNNGPQTVWFRIDPEYAGVPTKWERSSCRSLWRLLELIDLSKNLEEFLEAEKLFA